MRYNKQILKDPQLLFNFVAEKLWKQQYKSVNVATGWCMYRSTVCRKPVSCAAGHIIPDEVYKESFEDILIGSVIQLCTREGASAAEKWAEAFSTECVDLLELLQNLHDNTIRTDVDGKFNSDSFYTEFLLLADQEKLDTSFLKKLCGKDTESHV